jgi:pimeloyl-ACP methyl ester carboxylesterase
LQPATEHLDLGGGAQLAFRRSRGEDPVVLFLPGFRSDMTGSKAVWLETHCRGKGQAYVRFDYRGHGASSGSFADGSISDWLADALAIVDAVTRGDLLLVGSSMGGWMALLVAIARPHRVKGLVGIAAAPDFTEELVWDGLSAGERSRIETEGVLHAASAYGEPVPITRRLIEDGRRHLLLGTTVPVRCPVHLLHGQHDPDVPWETSLRLAARLESEAVTVELIKDGDHRLSRELDLRRISAAVDRVTSLATTGQPAGS